MFPLLLFGTSSLMINRLRPSQPARSEWCRVHSAGSRGCAEGAPAKSTFWEIGTDKRAAAQAFARLVCHIGGVLLAGVTAGSFGAPRGPAASQELTATSRLSLR